MKKPEAIESALEAAEEAPERWPRKLPWRPLSVPTIAPQLPATREASSSEIGDCLFSDRNVGR
jgi:hypothetical protein